MSLSRELRLIGKSIVGSIYSTLPCPGVSRPIFIIGCGLSGTTILGTALSKHRVVTYLNEPRHLWFSAYPIADIWTPRAYSRHGRLFLTESDVENQKSNKLKRLFQFETIMSGRPVLVDKLPINNFRLRFISRIFADARFIHIYRNGLEVARSIEKSSARGHWFGANSYKWNKLAEYAMSREDACGLPALCENYFDKGLLEWRLSTEAAVEHLRALPVDRYFELGYDELVNNPVETVSKTLYFIGLDSDQKVDNFVYDNIARKTDKLDQVDISEKSRIIGGKLLPLSMDGEKGLTVR